MFKKIKKLANKHTGCMAVLIALLVWIVCFAVSWLLTCGLIKLITMCFGWTFSWAIATGVWLLMILAKSIFNHTVTVKK